MMLVFPKTFAFARQMQKPVRLLVRDWHKEPIPVTWAKPEKGWTKLNFDGSCKCKTGRGSIGGVLRDHEAEFLLGYAESIIGRTNSTIAELVALKRGLELVVEHGWRDNFITA
ncbi:OLC1v1021778C1 [Oldenlandia corymbosa var. corymbosa]|uniref:OLC1v1021778C1 n=1 Tax=Oldenlandia corymbosa var. corymbosa TaxID=529605 RepID=A0AAV1BWE2_OLDCO|nr:OLC1v1021778C1 [Oldenlandia corymbosa var. corymbosa]